MRVLLVSFIYFYLSIFYLFIYINIYIYNLTVHNHIEHYLASSLGIYTNLGYVEPFLYPVVVLACLDLGVSTVFSKLCCTRKCIIAKHTENMQTWETQISDTYQFDSIIPWISQDLRSRVSQVDV